MAKEALAALSLGLTLTIDTPNAAMPALSLKVDVRRTTPKGISTWGQVSTCCPTCLEQDGTIVDTTRVSMCKLHQEHGPFSEADLPRHGKVDGVAMVIGTAEEVTAARRELGTPKEQREIRMSSFHAASFDATETGVLYALDVPGGRTDQQWASLIANSMSPKSTIKAGKDEFVLAGWMDSGSDGGQKFVRLVHRFGRLCIAELVFTSDIRDDVPAVDYGKSTRDEIALFRTLIAESAVEYEPSLFANPKIGSVERLCAAVKELGKSKPKASDPSSVLTAMLAGRR